MLHSRHAHLGAGLALVGVLLATPGCPENVGSTETGSSTRTLREPWNATTVPYDPECDEDCEDVAEVNIGHFGEATIRENAAVDDPVAQWGDCIDSMIDCMDDGGTAAACVSSSVCPGPCKTEFDRLAEGLSDEDELLDVFETVFIQADAVCRPSDEEVTP